MVCQDLCGEHGLGNPVSQSTVAGISRDLISVQVLEAPRTLVNELLDEVSGICDVNDVFCAMLNSPAPFDQEEFRIEVAERQLQGLYESDRCARPTRAAESEPARPILPEIQVADLSELSKCTQDAELQDLLERALSRARQLASGTTGATRSST